MTNLSDNEKRDIIKYLESGKPLPEKYRFLLFDTDKEVELLWNGKTDEVENMVLPFQAIEHIDEPRSEEKSQRKPLYLILPADRSRVGQINLFGATTN